MTISTPRARTACLLVVTGIALAGCFQTKAEVNENAFPADYKKEIVETVMKLLDDPTNLRDAGVTDPALKPVSGATRYVACVRFNPRNPNHEYTGIVERIGYFYGGHLTQLVKPSADECRGVAYRPFPELEKICLGTRCV